MDARSFIDIGLAAGQEIMAVYAAETTIAALQKSDGSPVTEADRQAEAVILSGLRTRWPSIPIVAEEEAAAGRIPVVSDSFFLVDPLDGTREFIERNGEFTVNIAFVEGGRPVAGLVYAPALGQLFVGDQSGAWRAHPQGGTAGTLRRIRVRKAPQRLTVVASRASCGADTHRWLDALPIGEFVSCGSSLKFCLIAAGEADIYPRFGRTMEWDTAAGDAILHAAGGEMRCIDGATFSYGKTGRADLSDFANPDFVALGDRSIALAPASPD